MCTRPGTLGLCLWEVVAGVGRGPWGLEQNAERRTEAIIGKAFGGCVRSTVERLLGIFFLLWDPFLRSQPVDLPGPRIHLWYVDRHGRHAPTVPSGNYRATKSDMMA